MTGLKIKLKISDILFFITMIFVLAFPGPSRMKAITITAFFCYMMVMKIVRYRTVKNTLHVLCAFLFLGYAYFSQKWARYPEAVLEQITNVQWTVFLGTAVSSYVAMNKFDAWAITKRLIPIALLFCVNVVLNGVFIENRLTVGINENAFGRLAGGIACFFLYQCKQKQWKNLFLDVLTAVFVLFTFLSGSRTAVLIIGIYVIAFMAFEHPTKNSAKAILNILLVAVLCGIGYLAIMKIGFLYNTIGKRVEVLIWMLAGISKGDSSAVTRMAMLEIAAETFQQHPWIGIGMNNFKYATYFGTYSHNTFYELAACLGVVGLALYYTPVAVYLKRAFTRWTNDEAGSILPLAIIVAFLLGDIGSVSYFNPVTHVFLGLAIGMLPKYKRKEGPAGPGRKQY